MPAANYLVGTSPDQVPTNADLGRLAFADTPPFRVCVDDFIPASSAWDDATVIQAALDSGATYVTFNPARVYYVNSYLRIPSGVTVDMQGAKIVRSGQINSIFMNKADGVTGGFSANRNIVIRNGIIDANGVSSSFSAGTYPTQCTPIAIGHCTNVTIENLEIYGVKSWHAIEINGSKDTHISNCYIHDCDVGSSNAEAIQPDFMGSSGQFPWFGPYDGTAVDGLTVENCRFENVCCAVGSHTPPTSPLHKNINIKGCRIRSIRGSHGIKALNWTDVTIVDNEIDNTADGNFGINVDQTGTAILRNYVVSRNRVMNLGYLDGWTATNQGNSRAINFRSAGDSVAPSSGGTLNSALIVGVTVSDNIVKNCNRHAITFDGVGSLMVSNNSVTTASSAGIWTYAVDTAMVTGNTVLDSNLAGTRAGSMMYGNGGAYIGIRIQIHGNRVQDAIANIGGTSKVSVWGNSIGLNDFDWGYDSFVIQSRELRMMVADQASSFPFLMKTGAAGAVSTNWSVVHTFGEYASTGFMLMVSYEDNTGDGANRFAIFVDSGSSSYGAGFSGTRLHGNTDLEIRRGGTTSNRTIEVRNAAGSSNGDLHWQLFLLRQSGA